MIHKIIKVLRKTAIDGDALLSRQFRDVAIEIVKLTATQAIGFFGKQIRPERYQL